VSIAARRRASSAGAVRDDTVSTGRIETAAAAAAGGCGARRVVSGGGLGSGCGAAAGLAACNTNRPWRRAAPSGTVVPWQGRTVAMLLCADAGDASADLASGAMACPSCGAGRLRSWGYGRGRAVRVPGGTRVLCPRRARCRSCAATHILLPAWAVSRRADSAGVIARAAAASVLHGTGTARLGAELGVPAATVRGWLRRLRGRAGQLLQEATSEFGRLVAVIETGEGRDPCPPGPTGSVLGDALALVAACEHAAIRWHGRGPGTSRCC
jgi:hypothetical protein